MSRFAVDVRSISKHFGAFTALSDVSFSVERGACVAMLGHNGAGKSSALSILLGQSLPSSGDVEIFGTSARKVRARIGAAPQATSFPPNIKVWELLKFIKAHYSQGLALDELVDAFSLRPLLERVAVQLSGGDARKVAVAIAFAGNPDLAVLDEPTTGLDPTSRRNVWNFLRSFCNLGGTLLLTTHILEEAELLADQVVLMSKGRVKLQGKLSEVRSLFKVESVTFRLDGDVGVLGSEFEAIAADDRVTVKGSADDIVRRLVQFGVPFYDLEINRGTLEDTYLAIEAR